MIELIKQKKRKSESHKVKLLQMKGNTVAINKDQIWLWLPPQRLWPTGTSLGRARRSTMAQAILY